MSKGNITEEFQLDAIRQITERGHRAYLEMFMLLLKTLQWLDVTNFAD